MSRTQDEIRRIRGEYARRAQDTDRDALYSLFNPVSGCHSTSRRKPTVMRLPALAQTGLTGVKRGNTRRSTLLLVMLIVVSCTASTPTPTPIEPATQTCLPAGTQTMTRTSGVQLATETFTSTIVPLQGQGQIYYVTTTGNDAHPGTETQPFRTIMYGISNLKAGDTLYIKEGVYTEGILLIPSGTSWDEHVTIAAYPGHTVVINGEYSGYIVYISSSHHIVMDGLVFDGANTSKQAICIGSETHHIRIQNAEIKNASGCGIIVKTDSNEFVNLAIHHNGTSGRGHGVYVKGDHNLIGGCAVHHSAGWGIHVYDNEDRRTNYNVVRNNVVYDNGQGNYDGRGVGIGLYLGTGNVAYNNIVWGNYVGIAVNHDAVDTKIYHNTVYDNRVSGIKIRGGNFKYGPSVGTIVRNNIVYQNDEPQIYDTGIGTVLDHNLVGPDPLFVDISAYDFHLQPTSPAIDSGVVLSQVLDDFAGVSRPRGAGYDIGAFEFPFSTPPAAISATVFQTAHTYYVATDGDDSNPGTEAQPFRTIQHGIDAMSGGDTLLIKSGTYTEGLYRFPAGTAESPTTVMAFPGDTVVINGEWSGYLAWVGYGNHHVTIAGPGLTFDGVVATKGISVRANYFTLVDVEVKNTRVEAIFTSVGFGYGTYRRLHVHDWGRDGIGHGIYLEGHDNLVEDCVIHDGAGWGIHVYAKSSLPGRPDNNTIRRNTIYDNGWGYTAPPAIGLYCGEGNLAYNNILWGVPYGVHVHYGAVDTLVYNNTIYDAATGIYVGAGSANSGYGPATGTIIRNNIVFNCDVSFDDDGSGTVEDHNLMGVDPLFVDAAAYDFHLLPASPAIDAGVTLTEVPHDFEGVSRPQGAGYDIGAYESPFSVRVTDLRIVNAIGNTSSLTVTLHWTAPASAVTYTLRSSNTLITAANWDDASNITVPFTASEPGSSEWLTTSVDYTSGILYLALKSQNDAGVWSGLSNSASWPHIDVYLPLIVQN